MVGLPLVVLQLLSFPRCYCGIGGVHWHSSKVALEAANGWSVSKAFVRFA